MHQVVVRMDDEMYKELKDHADQNERTVSQEVRHVLRQRYELPTPPYGTRIGD